MDLKLNEMQQLTKSMVAELSEKKISPMAERHDQERIFPEECIAEIAKQQLLGMIAPSAYGGPGIDTLTFGVAIEEMGKACGSTAVTVCAHNAMAIYPISKYGSENTKSKYLPELAHGKKIGGMAYMEDGVGFLKNDMNTKYHKEGDSYILNGEKFFVINGARNGIYIVIANGENGPLACVVESAFDGVSFGEREDTLGFKGASIASMRLENCEVPKENILGAEGEGLMIAEDSIALASIGTAALAIGLSEAALKASVEYANTRIQFGQKIGNFQAIQWMLVEMHSEIEASRYLTYKAAIMRDSDEDFEVPASVAKIKATESAIRIGNRAVQVHGGVGYTKEMPLERYYRDAVMTNVIFGTSEIHREKIAKHLLR